MRGFLIGSGSRAAATWSKATASTGIPSAGVWIEGDGTTVRRNRILDTGGTTHAPLAVALETAGTADIIDNIIVGVTPSDAYENAYARGVRAIKADGSVIAGNRVRDVVAINNAADGIYVSRWPSASLNGAAVTWQQARQLCIAEGGDLAVVSNAEESLLYMDPR